MLRCIGIRYEAGSWLTTTRSQARPPHDQSRSAWASERSRPRPCGDAGRDEHDRPVARDAEAPEQAPVADLGRVWLLRRCGRAIESDSAVDSVWIAAKFSALMRISRRRMPVSVADISEARSMLPSWRYLSITARSVAGSSAAAVQKVSAAFAPGRDLQAHRERGDRIEAGVERRAVVAVGRRRRLVERGERLARVAVAAEPALAVDLDPHRAARAGSAAARKLAASRPLSVASRGLRANTSAW